MRTYQEFAKTAGPLYARVATALGENDDAVRAIGKAHPANILAALHDLALAGRAPALADAYEKEDTDAAAKAAIDTLLRLTDDVLAIAARRKPRTETGRHAVLYPAIAEAAHRVGAGTVGLIDVGAGLNLTVDRVGITYSNGQSLGDPTSPVQQQARVVGDRSIPTRAMPEVVTRIATDPVDARWLRASLSPDQREESAMLEAELALATPPLHHTVPEAFAHVPADALPVVITTWALSRFTRENRLRFLQHLDQAATDRAVAWVSAEGVGVAPAIPTFGDRHASGHSILGVALFDHTSLRAEAVGRCWSRGRLLSWLG